MGIKEFFENVFLPKVEPISKEAPVPEIKKEFVSGQPQQDAIGKTGTQYYGGWITEDYKNDLEGRNGVIIYDKMFRGDYQVYTTIERGNNKIKTANWFIEAPDEKNEEDAQEAKIIAKYLLEKQPIGMNKNWMDNLNDILTFRRYGISVFEPTWVEVEDAEFGRLWVPKSLGWRSAKTLWQVFFKDDKVWSVRQISYGDSYNYVDIPGNELIIFTYRKEGNNIYGIPPTRPMYGPWIRKDNAHKVNAMGIENNARGMIHMEIPDDKLLGEEAANAKKAVNGYAKGVVPALFTPKGWAVNFKETRYDSKATQDSIRMEDAAIAKTTENEQSEMGLTEVGSKGMHSSKQAESDGAIKVDATYICQTLQDLIDKFVEYNFAPRVRKGKHKLNFTGVDSKPGGEEIVKDKALMEMGFLSNANPMDVAYMRKKYDLPGGSELEDADKDGTPDNMEQPSADAEPDATVKEEQEHGALIKEIQHDAETGKPKTTRSYAQEIADAHKGKEKKEASENFTFGGPGSGRYPAGSGGKIPQIEHMAKVVTVSKKYKTGQHSFIIKDGSIKEVASHLSAAHELGYEGFGRQDSSGFYKFLRDAGYSYGTAMIGKGNAEISVEGLRTDAQSLVEELGGTKDDIRQFSEHKCSCGHKHFGGPGSGRYPEGSGIPQVGHTAKINKISDKYKHLTGDIHFLVKDGKVELVDDHRDAANELGYHGSDSNKMYAFIREKGYSYGNIMLGRDGSLEISTEGLRSDAVAAVEEFGGTKEDIRKFSENNTRKKSRYEDKINFAEVEKGFISSNEEYLSILKDSITNYVLPKYKADLTNALKQKNKLAAVTSIELSKESKIADLLEGVLLKTLETGRTQAMSEMKAPKTFAEKKIPTALTGWVKANAKLISKKQLEKLDTKLVFAAKRAIENDLTDEQIIFNTMEEGESYTNDAMALGSGYATSEAINEGRWSMFQEMSNELQGFEFSALLEKTCDLCAELDSMTFKVSDPDSVPLTPPLHPHCHCILVPIMNDEETPDEWDGLDSVKSKFTPEEFNRLKKLSEVY